MNQKLINHIRIKNFKSIADLELDLGRVNVFIGENGCGKTNILEAVAFGSVMDKRRYYNGSGAFISDNVQLKRNYNALENAGVRINQPETYFHSFDGRKEMNFEINNVIAKSISLYDSSSGKKIWGVNFLNT